MESVIRAIAREHGPSALKELGLTTPPNMPRPDLDISPYNANTFPKEGRWVDKDGRAWLYQGAPGVFDVKLLHRTDQFPTLGSHVELMRRVPKVGSWRLKARVELLYLQTPEVRGEYGSRVVARASLSCRTYTFEAI